MKKLNNRRRVSALLKGLVTPRNFMITICNFLFCSILFASSLLNAETVIGKCVGVTDGDTATVLLPDNSQKKIRFWGIDAPESKQDYGQAAKEKLSEWIYEKEVKVEVLKNDNFGRTIGKVFVGSTYVNLEMVIAGHAWHYVEHAPKDTDLAEAEKFARALKRGVWEKNNPVPPWVFRKTSKEIQKQDYPVLKVNEKLETITVIRVSGADSIVVQTHDGMLTTIYLYGCDAPEEGQPYYKEAKKELSKLVNNKTIRISYADDGSARGKRIAKLYADDDYVNYRLVNGGYAHVPPSCRDGLLRESRDTAKASNKGMWILGAALVAPWSYRQVVEARRANAERKLHEQRLKEIARQEEEERKREEEAWWRRQSKNSYDVPSSSGGPIHVRGYRRKDGTYVSPHTRSR